MSKLLSDTYGKPKWTKMGYLVIYNLLIHLVILLIHLVILLIQLVILLIQLLILIIQLVILLIRNIY